ncbi:universal stress protein [Desulfosporosinus sp. BG]|uniref:universal stress protein n=1 Tax=Desulfosporosinus sp. BG TaxID=1633135 RepID=UPI00083B8BBC|nr:universal stress protein [Desulfosporosinus sp. BG]ODA40313.1 Universal stress protein family [Desulfosporosinus sp. BG]
MKKILVATDASEYSRRALKNALELARKFHSEVELLFVMYKPLVYDVNQLDMDLISSDLLEEAGEMAIQATLEGMDVTDISLTKKKLTGKPANIILREIESENIDLVVMGSHGYGAIAGALLGSVSQRVLHGAKCSVLIAK